MHIERRFAAWAVKALLRVSVLMAGVLMSPAALAASPCDPTVPDWPDCLPSRPAMAAAVRTSENGAYFWTGGVMDEAGRLAQLYGGTTLEMGLERAGLVLPMDPAPRSPEGTSAWEFASRSLALQAAGIAFVVRGENPALNNVYSSDEEPTLRANPRVNCIIHIRAATGEETIAYIRPGSGWDENRCRAERAVILARVLCPVWQAAGWPQAQGAQNRLLEWRNDPEHRVLYGGEQARNTSSDRFFSGTATTRIYSITPTARQATTTAVQQHVHSTPAMMVQLHPTGLPELISLTLDADERSFRTVLPSDLGCKGYGKELKKRTTEPPSADPSIIRVGDTYHSVESRDGSIFMRSAPSPADLLTAEGVEIWQDPGMGEIWAPELVAIDNRYYVYFSAGKGAGHRMYVISSPKVSSEYGDAAKLNLPDDKWAIDGTIFRFNNRLWFVWSGWDADSNGEQNLYIARMNNPTEPTGRRFVISQPRESWERVVGNPFINEGPEAIKDPNGQLHIVYSANGSWSDQYCLGDLRLRAGGDPTNVWDWYKSNGCVFSSNLDTLMPGWSPTGKVNGPGHHTFALENGDIDKSPSGEGTKFPMVFHAVPKGTPYSWANRRWSVGGFNWWNHITYSRADVPGDNTNSGYSLGFYEDGSSPLPPAPVVGGPGSTTIRNQDPSVIRVGGTYYSVESHGDAIFSRQASSLAGLSTAEARPILSTPKPMPNLWAPELVQLKVSFNNLPRYVIYFASGDGKGGQRMYWTNSMKPDSGFSEPQALKLPDDKWAVDGTAFYFNNQLWFVWSGWEGNNNVEQNLYIAKMNSPSEVVGKRFIISQPRESWERVVGNPFINEAPEAIKDPDGNLHIVYSANGSWSDQYCLSELRLRKGGDPTYVWDWYKANGCLFGSNRDTMMAGWDPTLYVNGPGHNSFVLLNGDINTSPPPGSKFPLMFHAVPKGTPYSWDNRQWFIGSFVWWGNTTFSRNNVPGDKSTSG